MAKGISVARISELAKVEFDAARAITADRSRMVSVGEVLDALNLAKTLKWAMNQTRTLAFKVAADSPDISGINPNFVTRTAILELIDKEVARLQKKAVEAGDPESMNFSEVGSRGLQIFKDIVMSVEEVDVPELSVDDILKLVEDVIG
jgi:hypothetical protein